MERGSVDRFASKLWDIVTFRPRPVRRLRDWCRRWIKFLRAPAQGPFWHEHPDR